MAEQLAITVVHQSTGFSDQAERMATLIRAFPCCAGERAIAREDEAEGEVARGGAGLQCVVKGKELGQAQSLVVGRQNCTIKAQAVAAYYLFQAGGCGKPQSATVITSNRDCGFGRERRMTNAKAVPGSAMCEYDMTLGINGCFYDQLTAWWRRDRMRRVGSLKDDDVWCRFRRPQCRLCAWIRVRSSGES